MSGEIFLFLCALILVGVYPVAFFIRGMKEIKNNGDRRVGLKCRLHYDGDGRAWCAACGKEDGPYDDCVVSKGAAR